MATNSAPNAVSWEAAGRVRAIAVLLEQHPSTPLAPYLAGVWGPELDGFWRGVIHRLHSRAAVRRLAAVCSDDPRIQGLLQAVARGLVGGGRRNGW